MLTLKLDGRGRLRVLCIGAHSDDIEIGCGGTILTLLAAHPAVECRWVVLSGSEDRAREAKRSARRFLAKAAARTVIMRDFRDSFFPYQGDRIKEFCHELSRSFRPDLVFTHHRGDLHQDHRLLAELAGNAFRDHLVLEYEIPKYDGDLGQPNLFVPLTRAVARRKARVLMECFESQRDNHWFTEETFMSLLRLRGVECNAPHGLAEGFHARKAILAP